MELRNYSAFQARDLSDSKYTIQIMSSIDIMYNFSIKKH